MPRRATSSPCATWGGKTKNPPPGTLAAGKHHKQMDLPLAGREPDPPHGLRQYKGARHIAELWLRISRHQRVRQEFHRACSTEKCTSRPRFVFACCNHGEKNYSAVSDKPSAKQSQEKNAHNQRAKRFFPVRAYQTPVRITCVQFSSPQKACCAALHRGGGILQRTAPDNFS